MKALEMQLPFIDLAAQQTRIRAALEKSILNVLDDGKYIMGPQVAQLEKQLADFCGAKHCLSCANGTDALQLALMALGVKAGDAVFVPSFTFAATAEVVPLVGATPVFVDVLPDTFNMDPESLKRAIAHARTLGLNPACVIPVDLFGLPADYDVLIPIARENGMKVIGDSAQGWGGVYKERITGSLCDITTTSFFPAKPLGCYGDGGALFTNDDELAKLIDSYRVHGKGSHKYYNERIGLNSRLDTLQAAILLEKLAIYADEVEARQEVAQRYSKGLSGHYETPFIPEGLKSIWAQYTLKLASGEEREAFQKRASAAGVPTVVYYPVPLHRQNAYKDFPADPAGLSVSDDLAGRVISLPMHPYLASQVQDGIISAVIG
ncbi:dTDP-4-amino-4,6-dideoxygalactose transaminase [Aquamicrobium lusatiense]|uniref:dTDP-4-amino-4,6-dideoxygalactose transaminase n=1 Tax=Aquamicrobium lusatiense TaxID=89772 RepID=A0A7W9S3C5_9HYPH|nr:DegT/DnrJ/EryC1/StrS family aminotransferase [Aquamicrobium lusatiense]MBB6012248.1 dTDP-4-amino-4,6-dideoxygalactose transaminase [Aquamicrobium lusatiense]